jgi:hypothetical protein
MYDSRRFAIAEIAQTCAVSPTTIYRHIHTGQPRHTSYKPTIDRERNGCPGRGVRKGRRGRVYGIHVFPSEVVRNPLPVQNRATDSSSGDC